MTQQTRPLKINWRDYLDAQGQRFDTVKVSGSSLLNLPGIRQWVMFTCAQVRLIVALGIVCGVVAIAPECLLQIFPQLAQQFALQTMAGIARQVNNYLIWPLVLVGMGVVVIDFKRRTDARLNLWFLFLSMLAFEILIVIGVLFVVTLAMQMI